MAVHEKRLRLRNESAAKFSEMFRCRSHNLNRCTI